MSRASKLTLLGTSLFAAGTIVLVHFQQKWEQEVPTTLLHRFTSLFISCIELPYRGLIPGQIN